VHAAYQSSADLFDVEKFVPARNETLENNERVVLLKPRSRVRRESAGRLVTVPSREHAFNTKSGMSVERTPWILRRLLVSVIRLNHCVRSSRSVSQIL
jgi:hypothetical protein